MRRGISFLLLVTFLNLEICSALVEAAPFMGGGEDNKGKAKPPVSNTLPKLNLKPNLPDSLQASDRYDETNDPVGRWNTAPSPWPAAEAAFLDSLFAGAGVPPANIPVLENALGDVVKDSVVNILDLLRVRDIAIGRPPAASAYEMKEGDLTGDGSINAADIDLIRDLLLRKQAVPYIIGPDGGKVSQDNWVFEFPAGAINGNARVSVADLPQSDVTKLGVDTNVLQSDSTVYFIKAFSLTSSEDINQMPLKISLKPDQTPPCSYQGLNGVFEVASDENGDGLPEVSLINHVRPVGDSTLLVSDASIHNIIQGGTNLSSGMSKTYLNNTLSGASGELIEIYGSTIKTGFDRAYYMLITGGSGDSIFVKPALTKDSSVIFMIPWVDPGIYNLVLHDTRSLDWSN